MHEIDVVAARLARAQHGVYSRQQVIANGGSERAIDHRLHIGQWEHVHPGVYRLPGSTLTWESRAMAACLTVDGGLASDLTAAHLWGFETFGPLGVIDVTVPRHARPRAHSGVRYHESLAFELRGEKRRFGIPVTGVARTVLDVCASVDDDYRALGALDEARLRSLATWKEFWECLILHARRGRKGIARYRRILERRWGQSVPHNQFARLVERLFDDAGLPAPVHEHCVNVFGHRYRIDLAYPDLMIAIELDGRGHELQFEEDRIRANRLEVAGWLVLRFTWRRLIEDPNGIVTDVFAAIRRRSGVRDPHAV
jgi:Protein of unknown function (DUF559)